MSGKYKLVEFVEGGDRNVAVVPHNWLSNGQCWWPGSPNAPSSWAVKLKTPDERGTWFPYTKILGDSGKFTLDHPFPPRRSYLISYLFHLLFLFSCLSIFFFFSQGLIQWLKKRMGGNIYVPRWIEHSVITRLITLLIQHTHTHTHACTHARARAHTQCVKNVGEKQHVVSFFFPEISDSYWFWGPLKFIFLAFLGVKVELLLTYSAMNVFVCKTIGCINNYWHCCRFFRKTEKEGGDSPSAEWCAGDRHGGWRACGSSSKETVKTA